MKGRHRRSFDSATLLPEVREHLKDKTLAGWQRQRLMVAQSGLAGLLTLPQIAEQAGVHPRTVSTWLDALRSGGVAALLSRRSKGRGPQSLLSEPVKEAMREELRKGQWRRAEDARQWLQQQLDCELSLAVVYKYLGKCQARLKVPRPHHEKQDPAAVETFCDTLCAQLHEKAGCLHQTVHIWVIDEMRTGLKPVTRRVWTQRGVKPVVTVWPRYEWGYVFGALELCGKSGAQFFHVDGVNQQVTAVFYRQLVQSDPHALHIVIADGAGFHLPDGHKLLPPQVRVITLPSYSPELNPVEQLWDIVKDRICNRVWPDMPSLEIAINLVLSEYWTSPQRVCSLVGNSVAALHANASSRTILVA
jgi:transposase